MHSHINYRLEAPQQPGVYLLTMQLRLNTPGIEPSLPAFIVFNNNTDPAEAASAAAYLEELLAPHTCPADVDGSGTIDLDDLNIVLTRFGQQTSEGDTDGNGIVDLDDLNAVLTAFGQACA